MATARSGPVARGRGTAGRRAAASVVVALVAAAVAFAVAFAVAGESAAPSDVARPDRAPAFGTPDGAPGQAASGALAAPATAAVPDPAQKVFGVAYGDTLTAMAPAELASTMAMAAALGAGWVRADLSWEDVEPSGPGLDDWSPFDRLVAAARANGLQVMPVVAYTPGWARPHGCGTDKCAPADPTAFARFVARAAARYAPAGVHTWEVWNEENTTGFWKPSPSADQYAALFDVTAATVRAADPTARLIVGGLAATLSVKGSIDPRTYLARLCGDGVNRVADAIGYHPYTYPYLASQVEPWGTAWNKIDSTPFSLSSVLAAAGTPSIPVWVTEFGAPTGGPGRAAAGASANGDADHVTEAWQARIAADAVGTVESSRRVAALFWYADRDLPGGRRAEDFYGLRRADGSLKPAYSAFQRALARGRP